MNNLLHGTWTTFYMEHEQPLNKVAAEELNGDKGNPC